MIRTNAMIIELFNCIGSSAMEISMILCLKNSLIKYTTSKTTVCSSLTPQSILPFQTTSFNYVMLTSIVSRKI